jgi:hypothetical protein
MKKNTNTPLTYNSRVQAESPDSRAIPKVKKRKRNVNNVPIIKKNQKSSPTYNSRVSGIITKEKRQKETLVTFQK